MGKYQHFRRGDTSTLQKSHYLRRGDTSTLGKSQYKEEEKHHLWGNINNMGEETLIIIE